MALRLKNIPIIGKVLKNIFKIIRNRPVFSSSYNYWEERYRKGGTSGPGSYNRLAAYKGDIINRFVSEHQVQSVIELGCGDGNQLKYFQFENYIGVDVSKTVIQNCKNKWSSDKTKEFVVLGDFMNQKADLSISLDVIYHLVEFEVFHDHMTRLFNSSLKYVIIYSSNSDSHENNYSVDHVKHRNFSGWIEKYKPSFKLLKYIKNDYPYNKNDPINTSYADFYIFRIDKKSNRNYSLK